MIVRFLLRRLGLMALILLSVSFIVFSSVRLIPGDPAQIMLGERATEESLNRLREQLGLNQPFLVQYATYLGRIVTRAAWATPLSPTIP